MTIMMKRHVSYYTDARFSLVATVARGLRLLGTFLVFAMIRYQREVHVALFSQTLKFLESDGVDRSQRGTGTGLLAATVVLEQKAAPLGIVQREFG